MSEQKLTIHYLAGLMDADGCFWISKNSRALTFSAKASLTMRERYLLEWIQTYVGGRIITKTKADPSGKVSPCYALEWGGENASLLASKLIPYLVVKRQQACALGELGMRKDARKTTGKGYRKRNAAEVISENNLYREIRFYNETGTDRAKPRVFQG